MLKKILAWSLCLFMTGSVVTGYAGSEVYKEGGFVVRKVEGGCKLETNLFAKNQKPAVKEGGEEMLGILALFSSDKFYSEFFTNRKKVGQAQKHIKIGFDADKMADYSFAAHPGSDEHWRWQYLEHTKGLLEGIGSKKSMHLEFSNGKNSFRFDIPLTGASAAVAAMAKCSGKEPAAAKKSPPQQNAVVAPAKQGAVAEPANKAAANKAAANKAAANKAAANKGAVKGSVKDNSKEPANRKTTGKEPVKQKTTAKEPVKQKTTAKEPVKQKTTAKEPVNRKTTGKEPATQD